MAITRSYATIQLSVFQIGLCCHLMRTYWLCNPVNTINWNDIVYFVHWFGFIDNVRGCLRTVPTISFELRFRLQIIGYRRHNYIDFYQFLVEKVVVFFCFGSGKTHIIVNFVRNRKPMHCHKFANPKILNRLIIWSNLDTNIFLFATKNY